MHLTLKRIGIYTLMAINMIVGFSLLFLANEFGLLRQFNSMIVRLFNGDLDESFGLLLLLLAFTGPLGTLLYAMHPLKSWARVWFIVVSILSVPIFAFVIVLFSSNWY